MLYTRFYDDQRLDHQRAKAHINTAIAISSLLPAGERRAFNLTFNENGLALIEMHLGDTEEALRLVCAGLDRLDEELGPDRADAAPLGAALQPGAAVDPARTAQPRRSTRTTS